MGEEEATMGHGKETVEVYRPKSELEATIIRDILEQQGIDAGYTSNWSAWIDGVFTLAGGAGGIYVFKGEVERAKSIIADYLSTIEEGPDTTEDKTG
jgi:hypothetical protein